MNFSLSHSLAEARAEISGPSEKYLKPGSVLRLTCRVVENIENPLYIFWYHNNRMINYDSHRGVNVSTEPGLCARCLSRISAVRMSIASFASFFTGGDNEQSASACLISHMTTKLGFNLSQKRSKKPELEREKSAREQVKIPICRMSSARRSFTHSNLVFCVSRFALWTLFYHSDPRGLCFGVSR
jgi:hypothetical protein